MLRKRSQRVYEGLFILFLLLFSLLLLPKHKELYKDDHIIKKEPNIHKDVYNLNNTDQEDIFKKNKDEENSSLSAAGSSKILENPSESITTNIVQDQNSNTHEADQETSQKKLVELPPWLIQSSLKNAPQLVKGIGRYFDLVNAGMIDRIPSCHRFILVGEPGTGKTTLAQALAFTRGYEVFFIQASSLFGRYRNQTAVNIRELFDQIKKGDVKSKKIIIIDELHKLFEKYDSETTDTYENATAFWGQIDELEKYYPNIIVIGTANKTDNLPPEIKSRFHGKIITMPLPDNNQKIRVFIDILKNDRSIKCDQLINKSFITKMSLRLKGASMRDIQLLIDTAKIFGLSQKNNVYSGHRVLLSKEHFERAFKQLENEDKTSWYKKAEPIMNKIDRAVHFVSALTMTASSLANLKDII